MLDITFSGVNLTKTWEVERLIFEIYSWKTLIFLKINQLDCWVLGVKLDGNEIATSFPGRFFFCSSLYICIFFLHKTFILLHFVGLFFFFRKKEVKVTMLELVVSKSCLEDVMQFKKP